jgi:hypothetical protein
MTINHQFSDVDARGATSRAQAAALEASIKPSFATRWPPVTSEAAASRGATSRRYMRTDKSANSQEQHGQNRQRRRL